MLKELREIYSKEENRQVELNKVMYKKCHEFVEINLHRLKEELKVSAKNLQSYYDWDISELHSEIVSLEDSVTKFQVYSALVDHYRLHDLNLKSEFHIKFDLLHVRFSGWGK